MTAIAADRTDRTITPLALDAAPEVVEAMGRLGLGAFDPDTLTGYLGRNDNWAGALTDGRRVFIKRLQGDHDEAAGRFARLHSFQRLLDTAPASALRAPRFLGADEQAHLLAFEQIPDSVAADSLAEDGLFSPDLAARAGACVGALHSLTGLRDERVMPPRSRLSDSLYALRPDEFADSSGAELEAWSLIQHDSQLPPALRRLGEQSSAAPRVPCHGDLRLDQFLLHGDLLYLTDWEEFRVADGANDVGAFLGEWLRRAAATMFSEVDADETAPPAEVHGALVRRGDAELDAVRPVLSQFWAGYRQARPDVLDIDPGFTRRAVAFAGWHLFDRLLAGCLFSAKLSGVDRGLAGIGRSALLSPEKFVTVLGLTESEDA